MGNNVDRILRQSVTADNYHTMVSNVEIALGRAHEIFAKVQNSRVANRAMLEETIGCVVSVMEELAPDMLAPPPSVTDSQYLLGTQERLASDPR